LVVAEGIGPSALATPLERPLVGIQPTPALRGATRVCASALHGAVRGPFFQCAMAPTGNTPVLVANPGGGRVALFTVRPETRWPHDTARLMAKAVSPERDTRTVMQVIFRPHGADSIGAPRRPFLHRVPRRPVTGVQPVPGSRALRAATRAMPSSRPGAGHGPTHAAKPHRGTGCVTPRLLGSDATGCSCNHAHFHRD